MNNQHGPDASVWLVDDDHDDQLLIHKAFGQHMPPVLLKILQDGDEVLPALDSAHCAPKLILMDINMSRQNGFETLQQLRQIWAYPPLPIIIFSTSSDHQDQLKALALGANYFLTKPSNFFQLQSLVGKLVHDWELGMAA